MKLLNWCGRHKILAFWVVAIIVIIAYSLLVASSGIGNYVERGASLATLVMISFIVYLAIIWLYAFIRKRMKHGVKKLKN